MTVRFTHREDVIRIFGAGYGRKGKRIVNAKIKYTDEPLGNPKVVADFLPSPEDRVFREEGVKVTPTLSTIRNLYQHAQRGRARKWRAPVSAAVNFSAATARAAI